MNHTGKPMQQRISQMFGGVSIPNLLTLGRLIAIPIFIVVYYLPFHNSHIASAALFAIAGMTDWLDGYLARKWNQTTKLGAFLDPVADKMMVSLALVVLVSAHGSLLMTIPAIVIIGREITISALREWMAELGKRASVAVSYVGKIKAMMQMAAITGLLGSSTSLDDWNVMVSFGLLYIATALTLWSMVQYLKAAWPDLKES